MNIQNIISMLSGLALFLYGITLMGEGLNLVAGNKLEVVLYRLTSSRFKGILLGTLVTAVIQSSTAASVMVVGFVNSGLMHFAQAVAVILGSILGTSVTGWIVALSAIGGGGGWVDLLSTAALTGIVAVIGIILKKFCKKPVQHHIGDILLGFAVMLFGLSVMKPLHDSESFLRWMVSLSNPLLGFLIGAVFTAFVQSSAASVGVLQALAVTGAVSFGDAYSLLLGIAVGGALPVLLGTLSADRSGLRTAVAHLLIDVLSALLCGVLFFAADAILPFSFADKPVGIVDIAILNTVIRLFTVIVFAPFIGALEKLCLAIVRVREEEQQPQEQQPQILLEERFMRYPALALEQSRRVVDEMAQLVQSDLLSSIALLSAYSDDVYKRIQEQEAMADRYEDALGSYLLRITPTELTKEQNEALHKYLHTITDFERISDHANNIADCAKEIFEKQIVFSEASKHELEVLRGAITEIVTMTIEAFTRDDLRLALRVEPLEELIDCLCDEIHENHIERLQQGLCTLQNGYVLNDLLTNFERVGDHCSNVAVAMIELSEDVFDTHEYLNSLKSIKDTAFAQSFEEFKQRYSL